MCRRSNYLSVRHRGRVFVSSHQPRDMRHIDHQLSAYLVRYAPKARKVDNSRVRARPGDDKLRAMLLREPLHFVIVYRLNLRINAVLHDVVKFRREVHRSPVRQVSSLVKAHPHNRVARLNRSEVRCHIRLRSAVWLNIRMLRPEQLLGAADSQGLRDIHELAAAVVASSRIAFCVLVREHGPLSLKHRLARKVLRRNQVDITALPLDLTLYRPPNLRVLCHQ